MGEPANTLARQEFITPARRVRSSAERLEREITAAAKLGGDDFALFINGTAAMKKRIKKRTLRTRAHAKAPAGLQVPWAELEHGREHFLGYTKFLTGGEYSPFLVEHLLPLAEARRLEAQERNPHEVYVTHLFL